MSLINKVVIIIPTFNEEGVIEKTIEQLQQHTRHITSYEIHILIFDSHSTDKTPDQVKGLQQRYSNIHLLTEAKKSGLGSAYRQAMQYAIDTMQADILFEFDADGSHQPKYIPLMLEKMLEGYDVVVGSRYIPGGSIPSNWAAHRKWLSRLGNWTSQLLLSNQYKDYTSGFRCTRASFLKQLNLNQLFSNNYAYKIALFWHLHHLNAKILEFPIEFIDREAGFSKFPRNNVLESLYVVLRLRLLSFHRYFKTCLVGSIGLLIQLTLFNVLRHFLHPTWANGCAVEAAIFGNFILNDLFTFKDKALHKNARVLFLKFLQFNSISLFSLFFQTFCMLIGISWLGRGFAVENTLLLFGVAISSICNYFAYTLLIWKHHEA